MKLQSKLMMAFALVCVIVQLGAFTAVSAQRKSGHEPKNEDPKKGLQSGKPAIMVVADAAGSAYWTKDITAAEVENAVAESGRFVTLTQAAREAAIKEKRYAQSDLVDPTKAVEVGKAIGARYVLSAKCISAEEKEDSGGLNTRFGRFGSKKHKLDVAVQMQMYDVKTEQIVPGLSRTFTDKVEVKSGSGSVLGVSSDENKSLSKETTYREMIKKFANEFVGGISFPIEALVVKVAGDEVTLDEGENASVKEGMEFQISNKGEPIKNAAGEVLGYDTTVYGKIRIEHVEPKFSKGRIIESGNNGPIKPNYEAKQIVPKSK